MAKKQIEKSLSVDIKLINKVNAPNLQSFVHGVYQNDWLLIAGTNEGLHNLNGNYASTSFLEKSFNQKIYVYDFSEDKLVYISLKELTAIVKANFNRYESLLNKYLNVFRNTNALSKQVGDYLYIVGGYGPESYNGHSENYITYNHVAKIHIPSLISIVTRDYKNVDVEKLFAFGNHSNFAVTGGELLFFNETFYLALGQNFGSNALEGQKYADAVYPFTLSSGASEYEISVNIKSSIISDVEYPTLMSSDETSIFRRRDVPIVPSIYKNPTNNKIEQGLAVYAGVFKPGFESSPKAWNDAIYVHPTWEDKDKDRSFTHDKAYDQNNYNVYTCPNFSIYESQNGKDIQHVFLIGGIGDGGLGFTQTGLHIKTDMERLTSSKKVIKNVFDVSKDKYYGSEAILIPNKELINFQETSTSEPTEIIDLEKNTKKKSTITIGYIYGGIESAIKNPTGGDGKTSASNKIWEVKVSLDS